MFYLVQRTDCRRFTIAHDIDPVYAKSLKTAIQSGVEALCYSARVAPDGIHLQAPLTLDLPP
jgi:sugar fermentation stimulation protein A